MKPKILLVTDSPFQNTGQGIVHRKIGMELCKRGYGVVSIGYSSEVSPDIQVPWYVYKTEHRRDYYGKGIFNSVIVNERPDIVLAIGDIWNFDHIPNCQTRGLFLWIQYCAIDGKAFGGGLPCSWFPILNDVDRIVAYTEYGREAIEISLPHLKGSIEVISHGVDLAVFKPLSVDEISRFKRKVGIPDDRLIYLLVARNQFRKNIPEILKAWYYFKQDGEHPRAFLFPHCVFADVHGWRLDEIFDTMQLRNSIMFLESFAYAQSHLDTIPEKDLNMLYNVADVLLILSGEGFGLPIIEAMACSKPVIGLNHSATGELVGGRGELVDVDYYVTGVHATERPLFNIKSLVEKMDKLYYDMSLRDDLGKKGLEFVRNLTWDIVGNKWDLYLNKIIDPFVSDCKLDVIS